MSRGSSSGRTVERVLGSIPPTGILLASIVSVQLGATIAKQLFPALGPGGAVSLRIVLGAIMVLGLERPRVAGHHRPDFLAAIIFGLTIAGMNTAFYFSLARLPLGAAVTLEFVGPLSVAIFGSRRRLDLVWALFAAAGVILLAPIGVGALDPIGVGLALLAGAGWASYILINVPVGRAFPAGSGLALAMGVAALVVLPFGVGSSAKLIAQPDLLAAGLVLALLSSAIPFSLEHAALKRLSRRAFGAMMSLEPGVAALLGFLVLGEGLGTRGLAALACVTAATIGSSLRG
ncbi:MAG: EamA family transporter [Chloroflexota bacterium]